MPANTQRSEAISAAVVIAALTFGTGALASKTAEPWAQVAELELAAGEVIGPVQFSPDGALVVAAVRDAGGAHTARIWSTTTGLEVLSLDNPYDGLVEYEFTPGDGDHVFAHTSSDMRVWTVSDGAISSDFAFSGDEPTNDVAVFKDHFLATKQIGGAEFWSADGLMVTRDGLDPLRPYQEITVTESEMVYLKSAAFTLHMDLAGFDPATDELTEAEGSFGPYELFLASTASGDMIATYPEVAEDGLWVVSEPTVRIRDNIPAVTSDTPALLEITEFDGEIVSAAFSVDDTMLLMRSDTGVVSLRALSDGELLASTSAPADPVTEAVLTDGNQVMMSLTSGNARLFDPEANVALQEFPAPASNLSMSPDGRMMVMSETGTSGARIWQKTAE